MISFDVQFSYFRNTFDVLKMKIELMDLKLILVPVCATPVDMQVAYFFTAV